MWSVRGIPTESPSKSTCAAMASYSWRLMVLLAVTCLSASLDKASPCGRSSLRLARGKGLRPRPTDAMGAPHVAGYRAAAALTAAAAERALPRTGRLRMCKAQSPAYLARACLED